MDQDHFVFQSPQLGSLAGLLNKPITMEIPIATTDSSLTTRSVQVEGRLTLLPGLFPNGKDDPHSLIIRLSFEQPPPELRRKLMEAHAAHKLSIKASRGPGHRHHRQYDVCESSKLLLLAEEMMYQWTEMTAHFDGRSRQSLQQHHCTLQERFIKGGRYFPQIPQQQEDDFIKVLNEARQRRLARMAPTTHSTDAPDPAEARVKRAREGEGNEEGESSSGGDAGSNEVE